MIENTSKFWLRHLRGGYSTLEKLVKWLDMFLLIGYVPVLVGTLFLVLFCHRCHHSSKHRRRKGGEVYGGYLALSW